jgi:hypothetical protein
LHHASYPQPDCIRAGPGGARETRRRLKVPHPAGALRITPIAFVLAVFVLTPLLIPANAGAQQPRYTGPGSCSSASCHGGVQPRADESVLQNEYTTWAIQDKHSRAFSALTGDIGKRIARNLNINAATSFRCMGCHTLDVPEDQKARTFDPNEGVSCENCHGAASNWLGPHTARDGSYAKSVALGLYDTRDLVSRNEKCLSCHLGDGARTVNHEMIASGHPDLYFEIQSFSAVMPPHWKEEGPGGAAGVAKGLAVGQAVQLREWMRRIGRDVAQTWPQYADLDCFACHHSLAAAKDSWRQERGYPGRKAGTPPFNASRFSVLDAIAKQLDGVAARQLEDEVTKVNQLVGDPQADRRQISAAAEQAAATADRLARDLAAVNPDPPNSARLISAICADSERIAAQGERSAEQAAMVLNSLFIGYEQGKKPANDSKIRSAIADLYKQFENPSSYNPEAFARGLRDLGTLAGEL